MNGEVNGIMEEAKSSSLETAPNAHILKAVASEEYKNGTIHYEDSNSTENSNHLDLENSHKTSEDLNLKYAANDSSNDTGQTQTIIETDSTCNASVQELVMEAEKDNSNNTLDDNCNVSNDSYPESMNSSQVNSEMLEQDGIHSMVDKIKDSGNMLDKVQDTDLQDAYEGGESEVESSNEGASENEPKAEDTVSIDSDTGPDGNDDSSQESKTKSIKTNDIVMLDNCKVTKGRLSITEIHEIESDNDDCIMTNVQSKVKNLVPLRRSSRAIKRKRYTDDLDNCDDDSDIEQISMRESFKVRSKPILINDTKALVEIAAKQMKSGYNQVQKKEPTIVIIDTNSTNLLEKLPSKAFGLSIRSNTNTQTLYQNMINRGTTVTAVSTKTNLSNNSQNCQQSILPSLTDDMFVVEAPSFIVPYVYEKPSLKPFREFVDTLGKELEEQKAKDDKELIEQQKIEKEEREKEKQDRKERGEEVEDSEEKNLTSEQSVVSENVNIEMDEKKKKKIEKRERRKRNEEDDDLSWDGECSSDSDDDAVSDEESKTIILKEKDDTIEDIKEVADLTAEKVLSKSDNYFDCSLGKFFIGIGLNLVQEYVQSDLLKQQNRKLYREKKTGYNTKGTEVSIASLIKNLEFSKENNAPYKFTFKKCEFCSFKTESSLALAHHLETPHMKNNCYKCNFCAFEVKSPHDILYHMESEHNTRGKLERAPAYHQCANCPFEDNGKGKLARHLIPCSKKFKPDVNLSPPIEWEPPAKIPKITRARNSLMGGSNQNSFNRAVIGNNMSRPMNMNIASMGGMSCSPYRPRIKTPMQISPRAMAPMMRGSVMIRQSMPTIASANLTIKPKSLHQPSISITPLPRQLQPLHQPVQHQPQVTQAQAKGSFVICEICDGYIKDLEQLRNHMQWIHKVKIHPKMIYNRPPLNCQKCQFRFFTDQGLERHLLGSHGLVTSSMQEAANKGKDAGRCPVCGRVYQWKLLNHVARDHNLTLKPAHLSYKCTVCTATFGMYKQFENHVYSAHSVVAKRVIDKNKSSTVSQKTTNDSLLKPLKINDEITIIPQPVKNSTLVTDK